jgi:ubiquinone/menaquinone biosynthesis C-methylase UbiE
VETETSFFDKRAVDWETTSYPPSVREQLVRLIAHFGIRPGERLLDVGTGPGVLVPYLRSCTGPHGSIVAFDLSLEMLRQAKQKEMGPRDFILRCDVHRLPFPAGTFDRVICFAAFPHFHNAGGALGEMARVVRLGGTVIIAHLLSRRELSRHHAAQGAVARDRLPDAHHMGLLFQKSGLDLAPIVDQPGRYLAKATKL